METVLDNATDTIATGQVGTARKVAVSSPVLMPRMARGCA